MNSAGLLPDSVVEEFASGFLGAGQCSFFYGEMVQWRIGGYMQQNRELKASFGKKLAGLKRRNDCPPSACGFF